MLEKEIKRAWFRYRMVFVILIFAMAAMIVAVPQTKPSKAKSQTKNVTVRKGKKKTYLVSMKKIRKIKVKYSKKGIAKVSLKKNGKSSRYLQITGKKKGKTTITVTIYETKKRYRKYKYKVTVKSTVHKVKEKNSNLSTKNQDPAKDTKSVDRGAKEKEISTGYTYEWEVLSCGGKAYGCSTSYPLTGTNIRIRASNGFTVLYIKTKDPDLEYAQLYSDKSQELKNMSLPPTEDYALDLYKIQFQDIHYVGYNKEANLNRVAGGYICAVQFSRRDEIGINHITIKKKTGEEILPLKGAEFSLNVLDPDPLEARFIDTLIAEQADSSADKQHQMENLMFYIRSHWRYYSSKAYVQEKVWWENDGKVGTVDCLMTTYIMMRFADQLGLVSRATYAGYLNHHYATVTIDGTDYEFDACPTALECDNFSWEYVL